MGLQALRESRNICLFGLGASLADCYQQLALILGREPDLLCDNAQAKWGQSFFGRTCISPAELQKHSASTAVVITIRRYEEAHRQLSQMGFNNIYVVCFDRGYDHVAGVKRLGEVISSVPEGGQVNQVKGKWTLITGASRGIGRLVALELARLGSNVILHSRRIGQTEELLGTCASIGIEARSIEAELGNGEDLEQMLDRLLDDFPPIDIVFNNAGISLPCGTDPWDISANAYLAHYAVNTLAPIRICYRLIPPMIRRGFGRIVNISSTIQNRPLEMAYACSKAALNKFVYDLAQSLEGTGVMISLVCPGHVRTDMGGVTAPHTLESVIPGILLGAVMGGNVNGRWFVAQDYAGMDLATAVRKAEFYYSRKEN